MRTLLTMAMLAACAGPLSSIARSQGNGFDTLHLPFRHLGIEDGLSQGMVTSIVQDAAGFMWFATKDGLNRYDGYRVQVYRNDPKDSLSLADNHVSEVECAPDGRLWVGLASKGLQVFDPLIETFTRVGLGASGDGSYIIDIAFGAHGIVWVGTSTGLYKLDPHVAGERPSAYRVTRVFDRQTRAATDRKGRVWGYVKSTATFRITPGVDGSDRIDTISMAGWTEGLWTSDLNSNVSGTLVVDPNTGRVFGIHPYFIAEYDTASLAPRLLYRTASVSLPRLEPKVACIDAACGIWIGSNVLWRFDLNRLQLSKVLSVDPNLRGMMDYTGVSVLDRNGLLWIATNGHGLLRYDPRIARFHDTPTGSIHWMAPTREGHIIAIQHDDVLHTYDPATGDQPLVIRIQDAVVRRAFPEPQNAVESILQTADGAYWMCKGELVRYDPAAKLFSTFTVRRTMRPGITWHRGIFPLVAEGEEAIWYGNVEALERFDRATGHKASYPYPVPVDFSTYSFLQAIHRTGSGALWLGTVRGLLRFDPEKQLWTQYQNDPADTASLGHNVVFSLLADPAQPERYLWVGTNGGGLNRMDMTTGKVRRYTTRQGLPNDVVYGILSDERGDLWMSTNKGIARFTPATGTFRNYAVRDGLQGDEFNRNAYCKLHDGTLCFGGLKGFNWFRPEDLVDDSTAIPIRITDIKLINHSVSFREQGSPLRQPPHLSAGMRVPYSMNMITFEFATMEFGAPESHHYQYKLEGFDRDWISSGTDHSAVYTNLDPGEYTFRFRGDNLDGVWDPEGSSFALVVLPPWWATWWAYTAYVLIIILSIIGYVRWRLSSLKARQIELEKEVAQATREIRKEKELSENLLLNILPVEVADELKAKGEAEAKQFDQVTVLFTDFKGFTAMSERLSPKELVKDLHECFSAFDRICEHHGLEKIKTIGDAFMAAGGLPTPNRTHALDVVKAALEIRDFIAAGKELKIARGLPYFEIRIGVHTGSVVAGIVGVKKFQYDIWGDTVNTASRMESSGEIGQVNISEATYALVKNEAGLTFTPRGKVQAKGKGEMEMYFVALAAPVAVD